ncbi:MAG TPA: magnesium transporter, partial [Clostridiales bacterium]|nr:magnesium transporter [Clostridiales bacterium]
MNDDIDLKEEVSDEVPERRDFAEELLKIINSDEPPEQLKKDLENYHENDIAAIIPELTKQERIRLYKVLGVEKVSKIFAYLDDVEEYIEELDSEKAADIIESMDADDAIDVLEELESDKKEELINLMEKDSVEDIKLIDSYDDDLIGSRMTTNFIAFDKKLTVKQAMRVVIQEAYENDNITTLYALNEDGTFYGAIALSDLIRAREGTPLDDIITTSYPYVYANETVEECIEELKEYSEDSIPVLRQDNVLIGVITASDIVEVVDEELGDDYAKLAGLTEAEDLNEPLFKSMRKRIPWLLALLALGLVVSTIIGKFQGPVMSAGLALLYSFQSLILDMSGNTGTQSLGVTIRVLNDEDFKGKRKFLYVLKEMRVALCNGLIIGTLAFAFIGLYLTFVENRPAWYGFEISACIGIALVIAMLIAGLDGTLIPILFKKVGIDPAVASGPLIT